MLLQSEEILFRLAYHDIYFCGKKRKLSLSKNFNKEN